MSGSELRQILKSKLFWIATATVFAVPAIYERLPVRIDFTLDKSLPQSVWITEKFDPQKHQYAMFKPPVKNKYTDRAEYLLKKIGCRPGSYLSAKGLEYYCNSVHIATAKSFDKDGEPVEHFAFDGRIPEGKYFMIGTHPSSYDGRYFGFVDETQIERGASPWQDD